MNRPFCCRDDDSSVIVGSRTNQQGRLRARRPLRWERSKTQPTARLVEQEMRHLETNFKLIGAKCLVLLDFLNCCFTQQGRHIEIIVKW